MDWNELMKLAKTPEGAFLIGFASLVFGSPAIFSKTAAEKFWIFGFLARWWRGRKKQYLEEQEALHEVAMNSMHSEMKRMNEAHQRDIQRIDEARKRDIAELKGRIDDLLEEIVDLRQEEELKHDFIVMALRWVRRVEVWVASEGISLPFDDLPSLEEFRAQWLKSRHSPT